jgi:hypothetical protein
MQSYLTVFGSAFEDLSNLFAEVGKSPWVMLDDGWRGKVVADFVLIKLATDAIRQVTPPAIFADVHAKFLEAAEHIDKAVNYYVAAIDSLDAELMTLGNEEAVAANVALTEANALMKALMP